MDAGSSKGINPDGRSKQKNGRLAETLRSILLPKK